jgi:hypothetical protein
MIEERVIKMRPALPIWLFLALLSSLAAAYGQQPASPQKQSAIAPLNNGDVLEMLKMGLQAEIVVARIKNARCSFDTSVAALKDLKSAAVPDPVLLAMVQAPTPQDAITAESSTRLRDFVPLMQALPWPILVLIVLLVWRASLSRLLLAVVKRVESGAEVEAGGVVLHEPPAITYRPYE